MEKEIALLLRDHQPRHTEYQIENFIIGGQVSRWGKYKQALREIDDRHKSLIDLKDQLEIFDLKFFFYNPFSRRSRIKKRIRARSRRAMVEGIRGTERELKKFVEIGMKLKKEIGDIDLVKRSVLESDSWRKKAIRMAAVDFITMGRLSQPTIGMILSLPEKDRDGVLQMINPKNPKDPLLLLGIGTGDSNDRK